MSTSNVPGGEVVMVPAPRKETEEDKITHGPHDVKEGHGGNDIIVHGGPRRGVRGSHNTLVQSEPGNTIRISRHKE